MTTQPPASVFVRDDDYFVPTTLARGPWDQRAQHGGAPAALLAHVAETTVDDASFFLARLTFELTRPIPVAPLQVQVESGRGRNVRRLHLTIEHDGKPVGPRHRTVPASGANAGATGRSPDAHAAAARMHGIFCQSRFDC